MKCDKIRSRITDNISRYEYIRSKAEQYLRLGPIAYRQSDYFQLPDESWGVEDLKFIKMGMEQCLQLKGQTPQNPFMNLGVNGFMKMMMVFHYRLKEQSIESMTGMVITDRITFSHVITPCWDLTLFNQVSGIIRPSKPFGV